MPVAAGCNEGSFSAEPGVPSRDWREAQPIESAAAKHTNATRDAFPRTIRAADPRLCLTRCTLEQVLPTANLRHSAAIYKLSQ